MTPVELAYDGGTGAGAEPEQYLVCKHREFRLACVSNTHRLWSSHGAVGVSLDPAWQDLGRFAADVGPRPPGCRLTFDRSKGLVIGPETVRWRMSRRMAEKSAEVSSGEGSLTESEAEYAWRRWYDLNRACTNAKSNVFRTFGARRVVVCERWADLNAFLLDVGPRPSPFHALGRLKDDPVMGPGTYGWRDTREAPVPLSDKPFRKNSRAAGVSSSTDANESSGAPTPVSAMTTAAATRIRQPEALFVAWRAWIELVQLFNVLDRRPSDAAPEALAALEERIGGECGRFADLIGNPPSVEHRLVLEWVEGNLEDGGDMPSRATRLSWLAPQDWAPRVAKAFASTVEVPGKTLGNIWLTPPQRFASRQWGDGLAPLWAISRRSKVVRERERLTERTLRKNSRTRALVPDQRQGPYRVLERLVRKGDTQEYKVVCTSCNTESIKSEGFLIGAERRKSIGCAECYRLRLVLPDQRLSLETGNSVRAVTTWRHLVNTFTNPKSLSARIAAELGWSIDPRWLEKAVFMAEAPTHPGTKKLTLCLKPGETEFGPGKVEWMTTAKVRAVNARALLAKRGHASKSKVHVWRAAS